MNGRDIFQRGIIEPSFESNGALELHNDWYQKTSFLWWEIVPRLVIECFSHVIKLKLKKEKVKNTFSTNFYCAKQFCLSTGIDLPSPKSFHLSILIHKKVS